MSRPREPETLRENQAVAEWLRQGAELLEQQGANPFRVGAYRRGADRVAGLDRPVRELLAEEGTEGLVELPDIGSGIAAAIEEILASGRWSLLDRLRGQATPEQLFRTLPGIGPELARRIHDELHVDTLEALETAAHDGSLERVPGIGRRRAAGIRAALESRLSRRLRRDAPAAERPGVDALLSVDREYRRAAETGELARIAPRRFNPQGSAWLPVLHTERGPWHFTALYSNTARAHELGRTRDWVVLYFYDHDHRERQATVVTERRGPLAGRRVVRGREAECAAWFAHGDAAGPAGRSADLSRRPTPSPPPER